MFGIVWFFPIHGLQSVSEGLSNLAGPRHSSSSSCLPVPSHATLHPTRCHHRPAAAAACSASALACWVLSCSMHSLLACCSCTHHSVTAVRNSGQGLQGLERDSIHGEREGSSDPVRRPQQISKEIRSRTRCHCTTLALSIAGRRIAGRSESGRTGDANSRR